MTIHIYSVVTCEPTRKNKTGICKRKHLQLVSTKGDSSLSFVTYCVSDAHIVLSVYLS